MNSLKPYEINFVGLSDGNHPYFFDIGEDFFSCFEESEITHGKVKVELMLEKKSNMLVLDFKIKGKVEVVCDRCLENYHETLNLAKTLYVKFGNAHEEQTEDIISIPESEIHVDVSHFIYEFLHLGLPLKRVHSTDPEKGAGCDPGIIQKLEEHHGENKGTRKISETDGAWQELRKLKF